MKNNVLHSSFEIFVCPHDGSPAYFHDCYNWKALQHTYRFFKAYGLCTYPLVNRVPIPKSFLDCYADKTDLELKDIKVNGKDLGPILVFSVESPMDKAVRNNVLISCEDPQNVCLSVLCSSLP